MRESLNNWVSKGHPDEKREEAARRILKAFDTNNPRLDLSYAWIYVVFPRKSEI